MKWPWSYTEIRAINSINLQHYFPIINCLSFHHCLSIVICPCPLIFFSIGQQCPLPSPLIFFWLDSSALKQRYEKSVQQMFKFCAACSLKEFYKSFQMRYHLLFNFNGKAVKTIKMFFWNLAMRYNMSMRVYRVK